MNLNLIPLEKKVLSTIRKYSMINSGEKILIAFSGGGDSTALTFVLYKFSSILNIKIGLAHLNHLLREEESDLDEKFAKEIAEKLNLKIFTKRVDIKSLKLNYPKFSIEEIARIERYKFLNEICDNYGFNKIATGHNADDVIENFFLAILEGKGISALAGIPAVNNKIIRPLIECYKNELQYYLNFIKVSPRFDSSNLNTKIPRNWIRIKLLPFIEENFKPVKNAILNSVSIIQEENNLIEEIVKRLIEKVNFNNKKFYKIFIPFDIRNLNIAILKRFIREIFKLNNYRWSYNIITNLACYIKEGRNNIKLEDITIWNYGKKFFISEGEIKPYFLKLRINEEKVIEDLNLNVKMVEETDVTKFEPNSIYLNISKEEVITIRSRLKSDKIMLLNTNYYKSLKELFIDLKIPEILRKLIPIVECRNEVAGVYLNFFPLNLKNRVSEKFKLENRKEVIKLYFKEIK